MKKLTIIGSAGTLLECGGDNVLAPTDENERTIAFALLVQGLALLSGVTHGKAPVFGDAAESEKQELTPSDVYEVAAVDVSLWIETAIRALGSKKQ